MTPGYSRTPYPDKNNENIDLPDKDPDTNTYSKYLL